uniref:Chemokine vCXCL4 n=1 Tax=Simian cytomegalovirus (strain Colburn) TaxID=50292 RepID=D2E2Z3_SCMVC|nr:chemokine vCXCL4 [Cercopithecine betaherpesvirus 5]
MQYLKVLSVTLLVTLLLSSAFGDMEQRCLCRNTARGIDPKHIKGVKMELPKQTCMKTELIATLKDGREICLDTESPMAKKIIEKLNEIKNSS